MSVNATRLARLLGKLNERNLDALLVSSSANRRYLSGFAAEDTSFWSSAGWLLVGADRCRLLTGFNYYEEAREQVRVCEVVKAAAKLTDAAVEAIKASAYQRVGFEPDYLAVSQHTDLVAGLHGVCEFTAKTDLVESLRVVKDADELEAIRLATEVTDAAMLHAYSFIRPGITEKQVAWELERFVRERGADGLAFKPGVAAGPNSAVPHNTPSERPIGVGEPIWVDIGARVGGYCSDLTRSFCLPPVGERFQQIYDLVAVAQETALLGLRAGMTGREGDALARDIIAAAGYADNFGHSLGHGVGLLVHEEPRLSFRSEEPVPGGSVVTVEPGIYLPGWGGVRIEDLVIARESGVEVLTQAPKTPVLAD